MSEPWSTVRGKYYALRSLGEFARYLTNWRDVWSAYRRSEPIPPLVFRGGMTLHHAAGDDPIALFREIFVRRTYDRGVYRPAPGHTVLDIGGNIGFFAHYLVWRAPGIQVHSFEPGRAARAVFEHSLEVNRLSAHIHLHPCAVADRRRSLQLHAAANSAQRSAFANEFVESDGAETVDAISLEDALARTSASTVDLLKIDAEGSEIEIVEGAAPHVWPRVRRVVFEYHDRFRPGCFDRVASVLRDHGFQSVRRVEPVIVAGLGVAHATR